MPNFYKKEYNGLLCEIVPTNILEEDGFADFRILTQIQ